MVTFTLTLISLEHTLNIWKAHYDFMLCILFTGVNEYRGNGSNSIKFNTVVLEINACY